MAGNRADLDLRCYNFRTYADKIIAGLTARVGDPRSSWRTFAKLDTRWSGTLPLCPRKIKVEAAKQLALIGRSTLITPHV